MVEGIAGRDALGFHVYAMGSRLCFSQTDALRRCDRWRQVGADRS